MTDDKVPSLLAALEASVLRAKVTPEEAIEAATRRDAEDDNEECRQLIEPQPMWTTQTGRNHP